MKLNAHASRSQAVAGLSVNHGRLISADGNFLLLRMKKPKGRWGYWPDRSCSLSIVEEPAYLEYSQTLRVIQQRNAITRQTKPVVIIFFNQAGLLGGNQAL